MNLGHGADMFQSRAYTSGVSRPQRDKVLKGCCWELCAMLGYLASRGEMRLDYLEHSYSEVLLKYDRDRESF